MHVAILLIDFTPNLISDNKSNHNNDDSVHL